MKTHVEASAVFVRHHYVSRALLKRLRDSTSIHKSTDQNEIAWSYELQPEPVLPGTPKLHGWTVILVAKVGKWRASATVFRNVAAGELPPELVSIAKEWEAADDARTALPEDQQVKRFTRELELTLQEPPPGFAIVTRPKS
jgi:hypothetical protein